MRKKLNIWNDPWFLVFLMLCFGALISIGIISYIDPRSSRISIEKRPKSLTKENSKPSECDFWYNRGVKDSTPVLNCQTSWKEFYEGYFPNENQICYCNGYYRR